jgi:hypothetical protein
MLVLKFYENFVIFLNFLNIEKKNHLKKKINFHPIFFLNFLEISYPIQLLIFNAIYS